MDGATADVYKRLIASDAVWLFLIVFLAAHRLQLSRMLWFLFLALVILFRWRTQNQGLRCCQHLMSGVADATHRGPETPFLWWW
jgi:hypothetical protein